MNALKAKTAIVTGASSGIGKQIALTLAQHGMNVCLLGRNTRALEEVAKKASRNATETSYFAIDLSKEAEIVETCRLIESQLTRIDVLVHGAGVISLGRLSTASVEDFDRQFQVNTRAPFLLTQTLLPMLKKQKGQIVFVNSSAGMQAGTGNGQYAATKFALKAIADSFRHELNPLGLRVLSVFPGRTASPMQAEIFQTEKRDYRPDQLLQAEDIADMVYSALALPPTAEVTDIHVRPLVKS